MNAARSFPLLAILCIGCSSTTPPVPKPAAAVKPSPLSMTRFVSIPARVAADVQQDPGNPGLLSFTDSGDDERAEGPSTFDVLPDGGFVIADPLRQRIAFYDAAGKFRFDLLIYFGAERLRVLPGNALSIVRAQTGQRYIYELDASGHYQPPRLAKPEDPNRDADDEGAARLESPNAATVSANGQNSPVRVLFEAPGESLVSIRRLGADARGRTYVALSIAAPGDRVDVLSVIRKYAGPSEQLAEITDAPTVALVHPTDEFRIRDGIVYQLQPKGGEVRINIWDTNARP
jgi:hypothetical protein